jgi:4-hydroxy-tetrahydrodipicolinate reductase
VKTRIVVPGVAGRMGRLIGAEALGDDRYELVAATARPGSSQVGLDVGVLLGGAASSVLVAPRLDEALQALPEEERAGAVIIDFTRSDLVQMHAACAARFGLGIVVGTTGLSKQAERALDEAAEQIPVLLASNCSLGANLLMALTELAAYALPQADVEIVELHHRHKRDAPSGTALSLGAAAAAGKGERFEDVKRTERSGDAPRKDRDIGLFGVRGGDVAGEHTIYLFLEGERIELTHRATDRRIFARGALSAAHFVRDKPPGHYAMRDVLGLKLGEKR